MGASKDKIKVNDIEAWNAEMSDRISRKNGKLGNHVSLLVTLIFLKFKGYESIYIKDGVSGKNIYRFLRNAGMTKHYAKKAADAYTNDNETFRKYFKESKFGDRYLCFAATKGPGTNTYFYTGERKLKDTELKLRGNRDHYGIWMKEITEKEIKNSIQQIVYMEQVVRTKLALKNKNGVENPKGHQTETIVKDSTEEEAITASYRTIRHKTGYSFYRIAKCKRYGMERRDIEVRNEKERYFGISSEKVEELQKRCAEDGKKHLCCRYNDLTGRWDALVISSTKYFLNPAIEPVITMSATPSAKKALGGIGSAKEKRDYIRKRIRSRRLWMSFDKLIDPIQKQRRIIVEEGNGFPSALVRNITGSKEELAALAIEETLTGKPAYSFEIRMDDERNISGIWVEGMENTDEAGDRIVLSYDNSTGCWRRGSLVRTFDNGITSYIIKGKTYSGVSSKTPATSKDRIAKQKGKSEQTDAEIFRIADLSFRDTAESILTTLKTKIQNGNFKPEESRKPVSQAKYIPSHAPARHADIPSEDRQNPYIKRLEREYQKYLIETGTDEDYFTYLRNDILSNGLKAGRSVTEQFFHVKELVKGIVKKHEVLRNENNPETAKLVTEIYNDQTGKNWNPSVQEANAFLTYLYVSVGMSKYPIYLPKLQLKCQYDHEYKKLKMKYDMERERRQRKAMEGHKTESLRIKNYLKKNTAGIQYCGNLSTAEIIRQAELLVGGVQSTFSYYVSLKAMKKLRALKELVRNTIRYRKGEVRVR